MTVIVLGTSLSELAASREHDFQIRDKSRLRY
jgi:hypothetical protein